MADFAVPVAAEVPTIDGRRAKFFRARRWLSKGFFAIVDQGFISGSNFVLGILLARWLGPAQYGSYALAFTIFVLLSLVYQSLLLEPMSVYGPAIYRDHLREYSASLIWIHCAIAIGTFLLMSAAAGIIFRVGARGHLPSALMGAAIAAPCVLLFWLARRIYYLRVAPGEAAVGAVIYSMALFAGLIALRGLGRVSPMSAFIVMALAAVITSMYLLLRYPPRFRTNVVCPTLSKVVSENWEYGKWALTASMFMWVPWNIFYTLVAGFSGMSNAGQLRALLNFALPMAQTYGAMSLLFIPHAAVTLNDDGGRSASAVSTRIALLFAACGAAYWILVILFREPLLQLFYAGRYNAVGVYLPIIGFASILWGSAQGPAIALRANKTPKLVFRMYFGAAIIAIVTGIPLTRWFGLGGASSAMLLASASAWVIGLLCVRRHSPSCTDVLPKAA